MPAMLVPVSVTGIERKRHDADGGAAGQQDGDPTTSTLGLLDAPAARAFVLHRWPAPPDLRAHVERFWVVGWDVPDGAQRYGRVLPHPCVNLAVDEAGRASVSGCGRAVFAYPLHGRGAVVGVKFRAGAFRAFLGRDVAEITEVTLPVAHVWPRAPWAGAPGELEAAAGPLMARLADELAERADHADPAHPGPTNLLAAPTPAAAAVADLLADGLRALAVPVDLAAAVAGRAVHALLTDPRIRRVSDAADLVGLAPRALQRLFRAHVGVSAQEVLRRGRMHLVAQRVADAVTEGTTPDWAALAADLGFADQPHFIREFRAALGSTPSAYAAELARA